MNNKKIEVRVGTHCITVRTPSNDLWGYRSHVLLGTSVDLTTIHERLVADLLRAESRGKGAAATAKNLRSMIYFIQSL